jgi:hypothetical protein
MNLLINPNDGTAYALALGAVDALQSKRGECVFRTRPRDAAREFAFRAGAERSFLRVSPDLKQRIDPSGPSSGIALSMGCRVPMLR